MGIVLHPPHLAVGDLCLPHFEESNHPGNFLLLSGFVVVLPCLIDFDHQLNTPHELLHNLPLGSYEFMDYLLFGGLLEVLPLMALGLAIELPLAFLCSLDALLGCNEFLVEFLYFELVRPKHDCLLNFGVVVDGIDKFANLEDALPHVVDLLSHFLLQFGKLLQLHFAVGHSQDLFATGSYSF